MSTQLDYLENNYDRFVHELTQFLSIPSISTAPENAGDVKHCAEWLADHCRTTVGLDRVELFETKGHPIVYGEWLKAGADKPTVLFYGHYDVQPVDPIGLWTNAPFEPTIRDGKVFARGATDDKGQVFLHLKALEAWLKTSGSLPCNVKILIEGEEEIGSVNLERFLRDKSEMLSCDAVVVSDTAMFKKGQPSIVYALRGLCYMELHVTGPVKDLHSGVYGGAVANPLNALAQIISAMKNDEGEIQIEGFYDDVLAMKQEERAELALLDFSEEDFKRELNIDEVFGERGYSTIERIGGRPTLDVNGFIGGFTGEGAKTVLPSIASAKISMRLVANQDTQDIAHKFTDFVQKHTPRGVTVRVESLHGANPVLVSKESSAVKAAERALERIFGRPPVFTREGGSIPVVLLFTTILTAPTVLMGFGLNTENLHSPNEHFDLENFLLGMKSSALFYEEYSK